MTLPADQRPLYLELVERIPAGGTTENLARYVAAVLHTLLRRRGDSQFLMAVVDAFTEGLIGRSWEEQRALAAEVIGLVLEKRPEIALAWQAAHPAEKVHPQRRRAADHSDAPQDPPAPPQSPPYEFADCETVVEAYVREALTARIAAFQVPEPVMPSAAYCHDRPLFLFTPVFAEVALAFVGGPLLEHCRLGLERRVYRHIAPEVLADPAARRELLDRKRPEVWKIITEALAKLAAAQKNGEAKLAKAGPRGDGYREMEVPDRRPRIFTVLGVKFQLGTVAATRKVRVKERDSTELDDNECEALGLLARFRFMAVEACLELPAAADFQLFRTLFEFDLKRFQQTFAEFSALVGHPETSRKYLFERLAYLDQVFSSHLSDSLAVMLFRKHSDRGFTFDELYEVCVGTAKEGSALASKRPFVLMEVSRRPRDLAFQLREVLRRRMEDGAVIAATRALCAVFVRMSRSRFRHELEAAQAVVAAFPLVFAGDPDEAALNDIGHMVAEALAAERVDLAKCVVDVSAAYRRIKRRRETPADRPVPT